MTAGRFAFGGAGRRSGALESDLVTRLRALPAGPVPDAGFKADLRAQLVAITARVIAESSEDVAATRTLVGKPAKAGLRAGRAGAAGVLRAVRRPVLAFASTAGVFALLIAVAVLISNNALPGDSLYRVKRASEDIQLSLAGSSAAKGNTYLTLAARRVGEAAKLLDRPSTVAGSGSSGAPGDRTATLVAQTLTSADSDSRNGMQLLGSAAVQQLSAEPLAKLPLWLAAERARLTALSGQLSAGYPGGGLAGNVRTSLALLDRIARRTAALKANLGCPCLSQANSDDLGPLPCSPCAPLSTVPGGGPAAPAPAASGSHAGGSGRPPAATGTAGGHSVGNGGSGVVGSVGGTVPGAGPLTSAAPGGGGLPQLPGITSALPGIPTPNTTSQGVGISVGPVQGSLGSTGVSVSVSVPGLPGTGIGIH